MMIILALIQEPPDLSVFRSDPVLYVLMSLMVLLIVALGKLAVSEYNDKKNEVIRLREKFGSQGEQLREGNETLKQVQMALEIIRDGMTRIEGEISQNQREVMGSIRRPQERDWDDIKPRNTEGT